MPRTPPQLHIATRPAPRTTWKHRWQHWKLKRQLKTKAPKILFIGDSITRGWTETGHSIWQQHYVPLDAFNLGIGGDRTQHLLWRLQNGGLPKTPPQLHIATRPAPRTTWKHRWQHWKLKRQLKTKAPKILFIGDSITQGWTETGHSIWQQHYAPLDALNLGIGGDRTQHLLWRLQNGGLPKTSPELAILLIGTNNSNGEEHTAAQIADGISAVTDEIKTQLPQTKVLILQIFPRYDASSPFAPNAPTLDYNPQWRKNDRASKIASQRADGRSIYFLDISSAFLDAQGRIRRDLMPDFLHLSEAGYAAWANAMQPTLNTLLNSNTTP